MKRLVVIDRPEVWERLLLAYTDYNIYQSYSWGDYKRMQGWEVRRFVYYIGDRDISLAQCLTKRVLGRHWTVMWVPGGPLYNKSGSAAGADCLKEMLNLIIKEEGHNGFYIRIYPMVEKDEEMAYALRDIGFRCPKVCLSKGLTYLMVLEQAEEAGLKERMSSNWRHNLNRSYRKKPELICDLNEENIKGFFDIYIEMIRLKGIKAGFSKIEILSLKEAFRHNGNMKLFLCKAGNSFVSGRIICIVGNKAYDIAAATTIEGRRHYASYFLMWEVIRWCLNNGISYFDMSGADPIDAPSVLNFKKGAGGKPVEYAGEWEFCRNKILKWFVNLYLAARR